MLSLGYYCFGSTCFMIQMNIERLQISFTFVLEVRTAISVFYLCPITCTFLILQFIFCSSVGRDLFIVQIEYMTMFYTLIRHCLLLTKDRVLPIYHTFCYFFGF